MMKKLSILILIAFASVLQTACAQQKETAKATKSANKKMISAKSRLKKINEVVDLACDNNSQCQSMGIGHSPCGGYPRYLVYSNKGLNTKKLKAEVKLYNQTEKRRIQKSGIVGICIHIPPPKTYCSANQCVAQDTDLSNVTQ